MTAEIDEALNTTLSAAVVLRAIAGEAEARAELVAISDLDGARSALKLVADALHLGENFSVDAGAITTGTLSAARISADVYNVRILLPSSITVPSNGNTVTINLAMSALGSSYITGLSVNGDTGFPFSFRRSSSEQHFFVLNGSGTQNRIRALLSSNGRSISFTLLPPRSGSFTLSRLTSVTDPG